MGRLSVRFWLFALVAAIAYVGSTCASVAIPQQFKNTKVLRTLDLRASIVQEDIGIRAENIDDKPALEYYFALPLPLQEKLASINAFLRQEPKTTLAIENLGLDLEKNVQLYKLKFDTPIQPGNDVRVGVRLAYTHVLAPLPAKIPQTARQHVTYTGNAYVYSPYSSDEMKTTVQFPSQKIVSYSAGDNTVTRSGNKLVLASPGKVQPETIQRLQCHFEYGPAILTVTELVRDFQVSHWGGNLAVEENYKLRHDGAELDAPFSRVTYQGSSMIHHQTNVVKELSFRLPPLARDVYYRDDIGNVSTSNFRQETDKSVLSIRPRYPLYGGWNYTWFHGYNADLGLFDHYNKKTGQYIFKTNFVDNVSDMAIDKVTVRVVLPEGATNVQVHAPFELDSVSHKKHFTNFDSTGRYLVVLEKSNVVRNHEQPILITYEYSTVHLLQKPLVVSVAFLSLFLLSTVLSKVSFTIEPKKTVHKKVE